MAKRKTTPTPGAIQAAREPLLSILKNEMEPVCSLLHSITEIEDLNDEAASAIGVLARRARMMAIEPLFGDSAKITTPAEDEYDDAEWLCAGIEALMQLYTNSKREEKYVSLNAARRFSQMIRERWITTSAA